MSRPYSPEVWTPDGATRPRSLLDKVWDAHVVEPEGPDRPAVLYIDLHLIHEVTSPQAFTEIESRGLKVRRPDAAELRSYRKGAIVIATMDPYGNEADVRAMADAGVTAFAMEFMPRITRAQSMDVLSSQANLAGYQAVIDAAEEYDRALPMMMTAAGTVPAAKVFVMGVGVAGLQAIATAKRLGAVVTATDVRPAVKEQVQSLGA